MAEWEQELERSGKDSGGAALRHNIVQTARSCIPLAERAEKPARRQVRRSWIFLFFGCVSWFMPLQVAVCGMRSPQPSASHRARRCGLHPLLLSIDILPSISGMLLFFPFPVHMCRSSMDFFLVLAVAG